MPDLIHLSEFKPDSSGRILRDPRLYFPDTDIAGDFNASSAFPHLVFVDQRHAPDRSVELNRMLIDLRKFAQRSATGDIVWVYHTKSYKWCWNADTAKHSWQRKHDMVTHGYWCMRFECLEDMVMWRLRNPDITTDTMIDELPGYPRAFDAW